MQSAAAIDLADPQTSALRKVRNRLIPFLGLLYFAEFIDRVNVGFAAAQMNQELGFSPYVYGLGAGIFFLGYSLFEVPSNLILHRVGARRWLSRIMITWAFIAGAMALVKGAAEAGFFPGIIYYLTYWVPAAERARLVALSMTAVPISAALGGPLSSAILRLDGTWGLAGWQWLTADERNWLTGKLDADICRRKTRRRDTLRQALTNSRILALSACYFGAQIGLYGIILWLPQIFVHAGISAAGVGYVVAIPYAIGAVVMVWWCRRSDRSRERVRHIAIASLVGFLGLAASAAVDSPSLSVLAITIGAAGTLAILPIFWTLPAAILNGAAAAGAIALINALGKYTSGADGGRGRRVIDEYHCTAHRARLQFGARYRPSRRRSLRHNRRPYPQERCRYGYCSMGNCLCADHRRAAGARNTDRRCHKMRA